LNCPNLAASRAAVRPVPPARSITVNSTVVTPASRSAVTAAATLVDRQRGGDPIGPAQVATGRPEVVLEALRERVTEGDESATAWHCFSSRAL
jgi:hypothetical protein